MKKNFAIIGCGGFVAPRHMQAIKDTENNIIAALDKSDSVGILDSFSDDIHFFTEFESFDRHIEKLRRKGEENKVHFISICSPNYLHDAHIRFGLRIGADVICEKPLVLGPWNLDTLEALEQETGKKVYSVLQLRVHPTLIELKKQIDQENNNEKYDVNLTYMTRRGRWYHHSWKGDKEKSGGLPTNLGIHFFDMLIWIFGAVQKFEVHHSDKKKMGGYLELEKARIKWFLSVDKSDLPEGANHAYRSITVNNKEVEFSNVFNNLHTEIYKNIMEGKGFGIKEARPSIELVYMLNNLKPTSPDKERIHEKLIEQNLITTGDL